MIQTKQKIGLGIGVIRGTKALRIGAIGVISKVHYMKMTGRTGMIPGMIGMSAQMIGG